MSTCGVPTGLMSVAGVIWMFASTNVFTAGPLFGATPLVESVTEPPATVTVAVASR